MLMTKEKCKAVPEYDPDNRRYRRGSLMAAYHRDDVRADPEADDRAQEAAWVARREFIPRAEIERRERQLREYAFNYAWRPDGSLTRFRDRPFFGRGSQQEAEYQRAQEERTRMYNQALNLALWLRRGGPTDVIVMHQPWRGAYHFQCTECFHHWTVDVYEMAEAGPERGHAFMTCERCRAR